MGTLTKQLKGKWKAQSNWFGVKNIIPTTFSLLGNKNKKKKTIKVLKFFRTKAVFIYTSVFQTINVEGIISAG